MRPAARGGEAPPAALWQTLRPGVLPLHADAGHSGGGPDALPEQVSRALNDYRRLCLGQSARATGLWPEWSSGCAGISWFGCWAPRAQAEKLASSCRALYEEADPSAFWRAWTSWTRP